MGNIYRYEDNLIYYHHSINKNPSPESFKMHAHDMCEILYFLSGSGTYMVEGSEYPIEPGSMMLMRPSETHKTQIQRDCTYERIAIHFSPEIVKPVDPEGKLITAFKNRPLGQQNLYQRSSFRSGFVRECLYAMKSDKDDDYNRRLSITTHLLPILSEIKIAFAAIQNEMDTNPYQDISRELVNYINYNLMSAELSLDTLSQHFLISKCHLNRIFKKVTGSTVWDYILIKRMMIARQMIKSGKPASEVCQACGFKDYSAFYRLYKKRFNVTPQQDKAE
jgi:AraC-like DNA-binding protein